MTKRPLLENTARMMAWYWRSQASRDAMCQLARTDADVERWIAAQAEALDNVQCAFFCDTGDRDHALVADMGQITMLLSQWAPSRRYTLVGFVGHRVGDDLTTRVVVRRATTTGEVVEQNEVPYEDFLWPDDIAFGCEVACNVLADGRRVAWRRVTGVVS